jgi:dihydroneopterin aldolase
MDTVLLEGVQFYGYHGVNPEERTQGQRFIVDIELSADLRAAGQSDDLTRTIDYSAVYRAVQAIVEGPPRRLLEAVAEEIAATLLADFPARTVTVTIRKPAPPLRGAMLRAAGVCIQRERGAP